MPVRQPPMPARQPPMPVRNLGDPPARVQYSIIILTKIYIFTWGNEGCFEVLYYIYAP